MTNSIKALATAVYREAQANAGLQTSQIKGVRRLFVRRQQARQQKKNLDPARFHFYEHYPPHGMHCDKSFARVMLRFEDGEYKEPRWIHYPVIPKLIQSAQFDCAVKIEDLHPTRLLPLIS